MILIILIGGLYLIMGIISLLTALLFIELGRPKDLIQSGLIILLGIFLLIYRKIFTLKISLIFTLNAVLINFYFFENFSYRWNQLLDKEKLDIKSFAAFNKNFSMIYQVIVLDLKNLLFNNKIKSLFKNTSNKKKWVRKKDNNNSSSKQLFLNESMKNILKADLSKEDIINDEKNNTKIDK